MINASASIFIFALLLTNAQRGSVKETQGQGNRILVVQGILDDTGNVLTRVDKPVIYKRKLDRPTPDQETGRYVVQVVYDSGDKFSIYFDGLVAGDAPGMGVQHGFFEVQIPLKGKPVALTITDTLNNRLLTSFSKDEFRYD